MKLDSPLNLSSLSLAACALALGSILPTQATAQSRDDKERSASASGMRAQLSVATDDVEERGLNALVGKDVRGADGEKIGDIKDFFVDSKSGKVAFVIVSSGGLAGVGDTLRLLPSAALKRASDGKRFTSAIDDAKWNKLPVINEQDYEAGRINITPNQRRELAESFGQTWSGDSGAANTSDAADFGTRMVRASKIKGLPVRSGTQEVGEIENVIIDLPRGTAMALLDTEANFTSADRNYLVPLSQLDIRAGQDTITTKLTRADFDKARMSTRDSTVPSTTPTATGRQPAREQDEQLTPTGRTEAAQTNASGLKPALQSAATAIKQMWDAHPSLSKLNLQVTPENGRLVFRGTVPTAELRERAKDTAEAVITGIEVDNHIKIESK